MQQEIRKLRGRQAQVVVFCLLVGLHSESPRLGWPWPWGLWALGRGCRGKQVPSLSSWFSRRTEELKTLAALLTVSLRVLLEAK